MIRRLRRNRCGCFNCRVFTVRSLVSNFEPNYFYISALLRINSRIFYEHLNLFIWENNLKSYFAGIHAFPFTQIRLHRTRWPIHISVSTVHVIFRLLSLVCYDFLLHRCTFFLKNCVLKEIRVQIIAPPEVSYVQWMAVSWFFSTWP